MELSFPCDQEVVKQVLPHRDPFLWVTRVLECEPGVSCSAQLDVDPELPLFQGHFPEYPVLPGVIIMEALAQTSCFCLFAQNPGSGDLGFFAGIDKAKFRRQVRPGDVLDLQVQITRNSRRMCVAEVTALVDGQVAATATQKYVMAPASAGAAEGSE
ncbi:MAG: 3-hydroxyacyl-ACP dehydratase FabZ [Coriobacteriia bacterium]|nr:3-hydroxyacyl-ACP dehydratase FabZ [Coriobacteriia bacterium]